MARSLEDENKALVERYFGAIASGDFDLLESLMAPDLHFRCAGGTGAADSVVFHSPAELRRDLERSFGDLFDPAVGLKPEILWILAEGDRVAAEVRIRGRSSRSGESYDNLYAFFFWIEDGRFREIHEHLDTSYVERVVLRPAGIRSGAEMPWLGESDD
ncbi:MAG: nuclear transport factor 2 family protein [Deltaproteobacteria bacterium]|jgi:ketosteroid isomerase-like protein|nr:nuclear transport factor 2 family protein [Deltaproteobacteria bacterium]